MESFLYIMEAVMTIGEIIKNRREELKMTQDELARLVGYKHKASITKIESGERKLMQDKILVFSKALRFTPEQLMGWDTKATEQMTFTDKEKEHIKKYRALDQRGRDTVDFILNVEYEHTQQLRMAYKKEGAMIHYPFAGYLAAAGRWVYVDADDVKDNYVYVKVKDGATFVFGVSGDSMEPEFYNGDLVYVQRTKELEFGDIGIFLIGNEYYIKEYGPDGLHSKNPNYPVMPGTPDIQVIGKVIGKVEE